MSEFYKQKHVDYCLKQDETKDLQAIGYYLREHLKVSGGYWTLTALEALQVKFQLVGLTEPRKTYLNPKNKS